MRFYIIFIFLFLFFYELSIMIYRKWKRRYYYKLAQERAKSLNKKLLVVGDPLNGLASKTTGSDYGWGDVCIDLNGCPGSPENVKIIKGRLEDILPTLNLDDYVIFISCVLEYVDDLPKIIQELNKVDYRNIFIVNVEKWTFTAYLYPYFLTGEQPPKYILTQAPPNGKKILYKKIWE